MQLSNRGLALLSAVALVVLGLAVLRPPTVDEIETPPDTGALAWPGVPVDSFVNFESGHVHPLDMTPDGRKLLAVNTPDNSLEVFAITNAGLVNIASIPVGHDPISVRVRNNGEAWVANVISDSVSIVDLNSNRVIRTLHTEDEPSDIVFAGTPRRAFVSNAERESIQIFNLSNLDELPREVLLIGEQPKAMAVSPDGNTVYTAFFESGNQTTVIAGNDPHANGGLRNGLGDVTRTRNDVRNPAGPYGGVVPVPNDGANFIPELNPNLPAKTDTQSLVVKKQPDGRWLDDNDGDWSGIVSGGQGSRVNGWDLKDRDVAVLNANTLDLSYQNHLGNILMAMDVNPSTGDVSVVGTDALNHIRFEPNLNGTFIRVNVSQFTPGNDAVAITDLNGEHLDYSTPRVADNIKALSVGDPRAITWTANGQRAYIAGMGSNNVVAINRDGSRALAEPIEVGEGPTGIVINQDVNEIYVLNRFSATISRLDAQNHQWLDDTDFFDPTPQVIKSGRQHLYNTHQGSGNGTIACGSCHLDGKWDRLAWDLGDPAGEMETVNGRTHHPLKGLKVTQSLIDIIDRGPLHWRGDKPEFRDFHLAFVGLQGPGRVSDETMQEFSDFLATTYYPPNPYRGIAPNNGFASVAFNRVRGPGTSFQQLTFFGSEQMLGRDVGQLFQVGSTNWQLFCGGCHAVSTGRGATLVGENLTADLRSTYRKLGFYYQSPESTAGFGMMADGILDTDFSFARPGCHGSACTRDYLLDYPPLLMAFSGDHGALENDPRLGGNDSQHSHQAVGHQETLNGTIGSTAGLAQIKALIDAGNPRWQLGMVVKGIYQGERRGFVYTGGNSYQSDTDGVRVTHNQLINAARADNNEALTWTLVHEHVAQRLGVDSDMDGRLDKDDFPDIDGDGVADEDDAFPEDPDESVDSDGDGVGDNADELPTDPTETKDSDGDGVGDNSDVFPNDPTETQDTDRDGIGDNSDPFNNPAPVITNPGNQSSETGDAVSLQLRATDSDGATLTYSAESLPVGLTMNPATGVVSGTPTQVGTRTASLRASDGEAQAQVQIQWEVSGDDPSIASGEPVSSTVFTGEWHYYQFPVNKFIDRLTFELSGLSDDADLYVRLNTRPEGDVVNGGTYDGHSTNGGDRDELIELDNTLGAGVWHVAVNGWLGTDYRLVANSFDDEPSTTSSGNGENGEAIVLLDGVSAKNSVTAENWMHFKIEATEDHRALTVDLTGLQADVDLYMRAGSLPTGHQGNNGRYDCESVREGGASEQCVVANSGATTWYVSIHGYQASEFELKAKLSKAAITTTAVGNSNSSGSAVSGGGGSVGGLSLLILSTAALRRRKRGVSNNVH